MPSSLDDTPNLPEDTSKKHPQYAERAEVAKGVNILPFLREHAAPRAIHNLSSTAREGDVLWHSHGSGKPCGASDHQGTIEEDPQNDGSKLSWEEEHHLPAASLP